MFIQITFKTHEMRLFSLKNILVLEVNSFISFKLTISFHLENKFKKIDNNKRTELKQNYQASHS